MQKKVLKNAGWIVGCKIIKAVLALIVTAITARYLGKDKYGLLNYAAGLCTFIVPIMQLGFNSTIVYEITNRPKDEGKVVGTVIGLSSLSSILCIIGVISFSLIANAGETETIIVCAIYSLMLFFQAFEMIFYWFQAKLMSKYMAIAILIAYIFVTIFQLLFVFLRFDVYAFAFSYSIEYCLIAIILLIVYNKKCTQKLCFSFALAKQMLSKSKFYIVANLMVNVYAHTDTIMLKLMVNNSEVGVYSAAWYCTNMINFVFSAIIDSFRPTIFEGKKKSQELFENRMIELFSIIVYLSLFVCLAITIFAPLIIDILYGSQYTAAISVLRVSTWMTVFSYIGVVRSVWILAEDKQKYLWIVNLCGIILNVVVNLILIPKIGAMGAAIASVATQFFVNVLMNYIIFPMRRCNTLMFKSLSPKRVKNIFTSLKK